MKVMTAKDGTLIYSEDTLKDYLYSNGLDYDDIAHTLFLRRKISMLGCMFIKVM